MKPAAAQSNKTDTEESRVAERFHRWLAGLRRRKMQQQDRDRRRRWLIALLLALLESKLMQVVFPVHCVAPYPARPKQKSSRPRNSEKSTESADTRTDDERRYLYDYAPRRGEEHLEICDGLTWNDIVAHNRVHRPWLFPKFEPVPGMPTRYADAPVHVWTLLDHIGSAYHRPDAIVALKLITDESVHDWIDACSKGAGDLTWKDLRKCRSRTPNATLYEIPRYAARWREEQRREAEERKREAKETPENNGPKPPGLN
ncbi:Hypothetical protein NGAL_HAMBI2610_48830 [Neorhizobium galegae bv. orientalis]|nr:Hypothetical protein NGAL_HAMBI2610_48830 [Neorhizobium galegae bv. orientalis]